MSETIEATFRIVTPMFLGGADQGISDGIRPPSVKGALRCWWRALNWGRFRTEAGADDASALTKMHAEEARLFGLAADEVGTGGQGCFLLKVHHDNLGTTAKNSIHFGFKPTRLINRNGRNEIDRNHLAGARYLGYGLMVPFTSKDQDTGVTKYAGQLMRECLNENKEFTLKLIFRNIVEPSINDALIAWGLLGSLGSRARHGMGSIALTSLRQDKVERWTVPVSESDYDARVEEYINNRIRISTTLPPFSAFWQSARIDRLISTTDCYSVLDDFGKALMMYRSWGSSALGNLLPGGASEKRFKDDHDWFKNPGWQIYNPNFHPKRAVFGMPHNYHKGHHHVTPASHNRRSSPLLFHAHPIGDKFVGVSIYLPSLFLPDGEMIKANGIDVPATIDWSVITDFIDGKVGNPPSAIDRFPGKKTILP
jgi:CRISPR-associated protein Cmr1